MMVARREVWAQDQSLRLYRNGRGELEAEMNRETIGKVRLVLTFPVTKPEGTFLYAPHWIKRFILFFRWMNWIKKANRLPGKNCSEAI